MRHVFYALIDRGAPVDRLPITIGRYLFGDVWSAVFKKADLKKKLMTRVLWEEWQDMQRHRLSLCPAWVK